MRAFKYLSWKAPSGYCCSKCGAKNQKLWRQWNTLADFIQLLCFFCACIDQKLDADKTDVRDQLGHLAAAVPTEDGKTFWGYTSVPSAGVAWWWRLPPASEEREVEPEQPRPEPPDYKAQVEYCIEADSNTAFRLWQHWHNAFDSWEQVNPGFWQVIGHGKNAAGKKMPICVGVEYARIEGHLVAFIYGTSVLVDHDAIADWRRKTFVNAKGVDNEENFHNCVSGIGIEIKRKYERCSNCKQGAWFDKSEDARSA